MDEKGLDMVEKCCSDEVISTYKITEYYNPIWGKRIELKRELVGYKCPVCGRKLIKKKNEK